MLNWNIDKAISTLALDDRTKIELEKLKEWSGRKEKKDLKKINNEHIKEQKHLDNAYTDSLIKQLMKRDTDYFKIENKHGTDVSWKRSWGTK